MTPPSAVAGSKIAAGLVSAVTPHAQSPPRANPFGGMIRVLEDAVLLMLAVLLIPFVILLVGAPIALSLRAVVEIVRRVL